MTYLVDFIYRDLRVGFIYQLLNPEIWVSEMFVWWKNVTVSTHLPQIIVFQDRTTEGNKFVLMFKRNVLT